MPGRDGVGWVMVDAEPIQLEMRVGGMVLGTEPPTHISSNGR